MWWELIAILRFPYQKPKLFLIVNPVNLYAARKNSIFKASQSTYSPETMHSWETFWTSRAANEHPPEVLRWHCIYIYNYAQQMCLNFCSRTSCWANFGSAWGNRAIPRLYGLLWWSYLGGGEGTYLKLYITRISFMEVNRGMYLFSSLVNDSFILFRLWRSQNNADGKSSLTCHRFMSKISASPAIFNI